MTRGTSCHTFALLFHFDIDTAKYKLRVVKTTNPLKHGQSQAVRLPKEFRFGGDSVYIQRLWNNVVLVPKHDPWQSMFGATRLFTDDFIADWDQGAQPELERYNCEASHDNGLIYP